MACQAGKNLQGRVKLGRQIDSTEADRERGNRYRTVECRADGEDCRVLRTLCALLPELGISREICEVGKLCVPHACVLETVQVKVLDHQTN